VNPTYRRLARINPTTAFLVALVVVLAGFFAPGIVGGTLLLLVAAALTYLSRLTWQVQPPCTRVVRLIMLTMIVGVGLAKIF
jgi:energy-coupling factor transporter transmembrane protein EcfT